MSLILKSLIAVAALLTASCPAIAGDVIKDPSTAFACQKKGRALSLYSPFGRAPTLSERSQCTRLGGTIVRPTPKKARTPKPSR